MSNSSKSSKNEFIRLSVTLFVISAVMSLLVALVSNVTSAKIASINEQKITDALSAVLPDATDFNEMQYNKASLISSDGKEVGIDGVWSAKADRAFVGYCVKVSPKGYGGEIETIVAVSPAGEVVATEIVAMSETSGIGTKIQSDSFLSQFDKVTSSTLSNVQTISGATKSSAAYIRGIEAALKVALEANGGEWNE